MHSNTHSRIHGTDIFTYMYHKNQLNVGKSTIHGSSGIREIPENYHPGNSANVPFWDGEFTWCPFWDGENVTLSNTK